MSVDEGGPSCDVVVAVQCRSEDPVALFVPSADFTVVFTLLAWFDTIAELASRLSVSCLR